MSQFVRYYEHMRPRFSNPTYNSSHVGSSMGLFLSPQVSSKVSQRQSKVERYGSRDHLSNYGQNFSARPEPMSNPYSNENPYDIAPTTLQKQRSKSHSRLQNIGTSSLSSLPKQISDRDIYEKQAKKYNIISVKPVQHQETIRKYPKYHLENLDSNFYKKLQLQEQYRNPDQNMNRFNQIDSTRNAKKQHNHIKLNNPEAYQMKRTEQPRKNIIKYQSKNQSQNNQPNNLRIESSSKIEEFRDKNHMGERQNSEFLRANFRAKMLNNVDELTGLI